MTKHSSFIAIFTKGLHHHALESDIQWNNIHSVAIAAQYVIKPQQSFNESWSTDAEPVAMTKTSRWSITAC